MRDELFHAFSHPCRRQIVRMLRWKNMTAGEIVERFDISQPSVSRHLDVLKRAGVVTAEKRSTQVIYSLNLTAIQEMLMYVMELMEGKGEREGTNSGDTDGKTLRCSHSHCKEEHRFV